MYRVIVALVVLMLCGFHLIQLIPKENPSARTHQVLFEEKQSLDCDVQTLNCVNDAFCQMKCLLNNVQYLCIDHVCTRNTLKKMPSCHLQNGGVYALRQITFGNLAVYTCVCLYPQFYYGPSCETVNPILRGTVSPNFNAVVRRPHERFLICDADSYKQYIEDRDLYLYNLPVCLDKKDKFFFELE